MPMGPPAALPIYQIGMFSPSLMDDAKSRGWTVISMKATGSAFRVIKNALADFRSNVCSGLLTGAFLTLFPHAPRLSVEAAP